MPFMPPRARPVARAANMNIGSPSAQGLCTARTVILAHSVSASYKNRNTNYLTKSVWRLPTVLHRIHPEGALQTT